MQVYGLLHPLVANSMASTLKERKAAGLQELMHCLFKQVANTAQPTVASLEWLKDVTPTTVTNANKILGWSRDGSSTHTGNKENNGAMAEMQMAGPASKQPSARSAGIPLVEVPRSSTTGRAAEGSIGADAGEGTARQA